MLEGGPVEGARVYTWEPRDGDDLRAVSTTGLDGRFRLGPLRPSPEVSFFIDAPGLGREHFEEVPVFRGADHDLGDLVVERGTRISGTVVDEHGAPLSDATLTVQAYFHTLAHTINANGPPWTVECGRDGRFLTPPLPPGNQGLRVIAPGREHAKWSEPLLPGDSDRELAPIVLRRESVITGIVVNTRGKAVAGATLVADYDHEGSVVSDAEGHFALRGVRAEAHSLSVAARAYVTSHVTLFARTIGECEKPGKFHSSARSSSSSRGRRGPSARKDQMAVPHSESSYRPSSESSATGAPWDQVGCAPTYRQVTS
jgi:hypothetical protein